MCSFMLDYCKAVDRQVWPHQHPLRQFDKDLSSDVSLAYHQFIIIIVLFKLIVFYVHCQVTLLVCFRYCGSLKIVGLT